MAVECFDASIYSGNPNGHGSSAGNCAFTPKSVTACPDASAGGSLSASVSSGTATRQHFMYEFDVTAFMNALYYWQYHGSHGNSPRGIDFMTSREETTQGPCPY